MGSLENGRSQVSFRVLFCLGTLVTITWPDVQWQRHCFRLFDLRYIYFRASETFLEVDKCQRDMQFNQIAELVIPLTSALTHG